MTNIIFSKNFNDFLIKLNEAEEILDKAVLYRGQSNAEWQINSGLQRELNLNDNDTLSTSRIKLIEYFKGMTPSSEILLNLNGKGCPMFEMIRHHQQNYDNAKITGIKGIKSGIIDFTIEKHIALFFANNDLEYSNEKQPIIKQPRSHDAAIYVVKYNDLTIYRTIPDFIFEFESFELERLQQHESIAPCIISPHHSLNDHNDPKPHIQQAYYIIQTDMRYSIDGALLAIEKATRKPQFFKIILSKEWYNECNEYLSAQDYTLDTLFPLQSIRQQEH